MAEAGQHDSYNRWTQLMKSGKSKIIYFGKFYRLAGNILLKRIERCGREEHNE
jgi:hypothetical protein